MENEKNPKNQKFENELKKAKLIAEKGAFFSDTSNLPAEIESQWLDHIAAFEDAFQNSKRIKMRELLGNPELPLPSDLTEEEISIELEKVMDLLHQHQIRLSTICEVGEREIYRFIVEELMEEETDEMRMEGWTSNFIYEEFHPNHEYDIQRNMEDFIHILCRKEKEYCDMPLATEIISHQGSTIKSEQAKQIIINFMDSSANMRLMKMEFKENEIGESEAFQKAYIQYEMKLKDPDETLVYEGVARFSFTKQYDFWCISGVNMPGFKF